MKFSKNRYASYRDSFVDKYFQGQISRSSHTLLKCFFNFLIILEKNFFFIFSPDKKILIDFEKKKKIKTNVLL